MARRSPVKVGLALALICVISYGQADDSCRTGCRGAAQTFKYREGTTYKYNFDSKIQVSLSSAEGQQSTTEVKATVLLTQQSQCNQVLRLQNVQVISNDGKKHSNIPDIEKPIRINYHDGHLEDSICITPGDTQNSLNIKRAVASIFQANLKSGHETDVFGLCPTEVAQHKEGNILVIQKSRNLNRCAYRESIKQDFFTTTFNLNSEIKSSPILNGDYDAKLRVKNGLLDQATVRENYLYLPFSVGNKGAKASVETTLKYVGTGKDNAAVKVNQPRSIIFEDPHPVNSPSTNVNSILAAVKQVAKTIEITVGENTAREFANLVRILRVSKKDDLLAVYNQVRAGVGFVDKVAGKRIFLDALLRAGNGDNIEVAIELLKNKELNEVEQNLVYLGLSSARHATENSINSAVVLLNQPDPSRLAYLGVGNLAGLYCRQHSCENVEAINRLTQKLIQKLGNGKASNRQEENDIVYVLKALGNIRHLNDNILQKITAIAQDKKAANRLRVTALETYLADPCKDKLRDSALTILKDIQQDSEIRIKAYLAVAQCPNNKVGNAVKTLLETEPSYQVGGFIVSHIRNLRASASPDKELAKQHLGLINVPKRFPFDLRKYSANGEFSYTIDSLGVANSIEANVIYSQNSFLPRSTSLNLTAEVFGHNFNFLELHTRQENLDRLVEHYFGPKGLLRSKSLQELWDSKGKHAQDLANDLKERVAKSLRSRRDVSKSEIDHINKQVQIKTNDFNNDLDLDFSVKAFGSEVLFANVNDDARKYTPEAVIDKIVDGLNSGIDRLKHFEETLRSNLLFLDAEFAYPTSSGFPLRLGVEGTSNVQVKASGAVDIRQIIQGESTIKISLIPSANIEVAGKLTVDALAVESGLKVISTLHAAAGGDLIAQLKKDSLDVKFSLPVKDQVVSASHDIVFHIREWGAAEVNTPIKFVQPKNFEVCLDNLSPVIGLAFCGEFTGPITQGEKASVLPFPLAGDAKVAVRIEREDLSHYHYREVFHSTNDKLGGEVIFEAVGQNGQKKLSLEGQAFLFPEKVLKVSLTSPITSASVEGRITTNDNEKSISVRLVHDNNEYFGKIGVEVQGSPLRSTYKPVFQYKTPQNSGLQVPPYRVEGQVIVENRGPHNSIYTLDNVRLITPDPKTISLNGKFGTELESIFADLKLSDGTNSATFNGKLHATPVLIKFNAELKNSLNPDGNIRLKGERTIVADEIKHFLQIAHGGDFSNKNNIFTFEHTFKYRNVPKDFLLKTTCHVTYPLYGADLVFNYELKTNAAGYKVNIQYDNVKLGSELDFEHNDKREGTDFRVEFGLWGLNNNLNLKSKRQVTGEQSQIENSLDINGKRLEVNGKIKHHIRPQDIDFAADLIVKTPNHNAPFHVLSGLKLNANEIDASHKVTSGSTVYVDIFLKANKAGNANGNIKINLKGQLVVNGQVKANRGSGSSEIVIELPSVGRTSKLDSTFTIHDPNYNIVLNIYPIFNQDPSKKVTLSTHTSVTKSTVDSKNFINVFGEKLEVNVKGGQQGEITNGKTTGDVEITLPNQHYLAAKLNREIRNVNNVLNGNVLASLEYRSVKNQPGNKLVVKGQLRNTKPDESIYDVNYEFLAEKSDGRHVNVDLAVKRQVQGESVIFEITNKLHGSEFPNPLVTSIKSNCDNIVGNFEVASSYGPLGSLSITGKHDFTGKGQPATAEIQVEAKTTSKSLKTLKVTLGGSVLRKESVIVKGQLDAYADAPDGVILQLNTGGEVQTSDKETRVKGTLKSDKSNPITIDAGISHSENKNDREFQGDVALQFGGNQQIKGDFKLNKLSPNEYKLDAKLETPADKYRSNRIQVHTKRNEDKTHYQSEVILTTDGKIWKSESDLVLSEIAPSVDIKVTCPEGKLRHLLVKITKLTENQLAGQLRVENQKTNFLLEGTVDANVGSIDDFHVKVTANSPSLKIDKYVFEAQNKPAKTGRRIQVTAKSGNKNILAGSTSYTAREEHGKLIVEGSGSFKVHDQTKSANFKYIRQNLSQDKNGETGIEISFDAGLGNRAVDAELKVTNKQFRILNSYCEERKQCAHIEVDINNIADEPEHFNQEIEIAVDLRKLGLSHEFGLKAVTVRKEYVLDHTVDVHFQSQDNGKYQYSFYLHPKEAGVSLTTPRRVVALEANLNSPPNVFKDGGRVTGEILFYIDKKNQPNQKSGIISFLDVSPQSHTINGEIRYTNPGLRRPLVVSLQSKFEKTNYDIVVTADIFNQPNQKLTATYKVEWSDPVKDLKRLKATDSFRLTVTGTNIDVLYEEWLDYSLDEGFYKSGWKLTYSGVKQKYVSLSSIEIAPSNVQIRWDLLNVHILKLDSQLQLSDKHQVINSEITIHGHDPLVSHLEIKDWNTLKFTLARKAKPQDKLQINSGLIPGQIADFRAQIIKNGSPQELGHATVKLDDAHFLKSDYNVQSKNIEELLFKPIREGVQKESEELQQISTKVSREVNEEVGQLGQVLQQKVPDFTPIRQYYTSELAKIKEEILADKTIRDASEFLYNILGAFSQAFGETFAHFSELLETIAQSFQNSFGKIFEGAHKDLLPALKDLGDKLLKLGTEVVNNGVEVILTLAAKAAEIAEKYQPELQQLTAVLGEVSQDIFRAFANLYEALRNVLADQCEQVYNEIRSLPFVEHLKSEYENLVKQGFPAPEVIASSLKDLLSTIKDIAPSPELKEFIQAISDYITKKLNKQQVDDKAAIDRIVKAGAASVKQFAEILAHPDTLFVENVQAPSVPSSFWSRLPRVGGVTPLRVSLLSFILSEDQDPEFLLSLVNRPRNWFAPFPLYGVIAQGQHIFTFDGKHLTFPGKCNYLLAHDAVDGNFTVIGSYSNGLLTAISLTQGSDTITLKKHGQILVNNAPSELPARRSNIAAYRNTERIVLVSDYGVKVICGPELLVCSVTASGFYHGKIRGLLGNGNNEPYDDFTIPNGKIVTSESEFGNSYKTTSSCGAVQTVSHHGHHTTPSCEKLFGWESSLRFCYPFVPTGNYRMACEHGTAAGVKDTELAIAVAYVAACNQHGIPIRVPTEFVKCINGDKPTSVGDQFSVKTPGKSADIVVLIDTTKENEATYREYVQPLIQQLTSELNSKGVGDIEFHIIAYGGENQWPSHITTNGGKLVFKGKAPNLKFSENPKEESLVTGCAHLDGIIELVRSLGNDVKLAFGQDLQALTYNEGLEYPFRANSIKSVIAVTGRPCQVGRLFPLQLLRTLLYRGKTINLSLITPISRAGAKAEAKNIVGFNQRNVFALGQTKNKIKSFYDLNKELTYNDYCIDFTVQNNGNVFVSDHIHLQPKGTRKQFIQITSHNIVDQLLGAENNYECECKYTSVFTAANVCKLVSSKEKPQTKKAGTKS